MNPLREKMINDMKLRRFAPNTQEAYMSAIAGLAKHYKQSPDLLGKEQVQAYLLHLMDERQLSWGTCNVVVSALRFFYTQTLGLDSMHLGIPPMKTQIIIFAKLEGGSVQHVLSAMPPGTTDKTLFIMCSCPLCEVFVLEAF